MPARAQILRHAAADGDIVEVAVVVDIAVEHDFRNIRMPIRLLDMALQMSELTGKLGELLRRQGPVAEQQHLMRDEGVFKRRQIVRRQRLGDNQAADFRADILVRRDDF